MIVSLDIRWIALWAIAGMAAAHFGRTRAIRAAIDSGEEPNWIERTALDVVWLLLALCCVCAGPIALIAVLMISSREEKRS